MKEKKPVPRAAAGLAQEDYYLGENGYLVFTEVYHRKRGYCCKSGCRHCPYGFQAPNS